MLTDEIIDDDIESLLYTQVYYGTSGTATPEDVAIVGKEIGDKELPPEPLTPSNPDKIPLQVCTLSDFSTAITSTPSVNILTEEIKVPLTEEQSATDVLTTNHNEPVQKDVENASLDSSNLNTSQSSSNISTDVPLIPPQTPQPISNITINQYIYPSDQFRDRLKDYGNVWSNQCKKDLKRLQKGILDEKQFFHKLKRRAERRADQQSRKLQKQELIRKAIFKRRQELFKDSSVICLSDSDNSDVEFVGIEMVSTPTKKKASQVNVVDNQGESDQDEIIYVEPPPVPVVHVEDDSDSEGDSEDADDASENAQTHLEHEEASNDFLVPTTNSDNFNFSLHGSEFQDSEFVRPANPHDNYDTESSTTSTSEFNRDSQHNNSVKTIVFNEVDFPREDMFQENDLEKFGNMITPSRNSNVESVCNEEDQGNKGLESPSAERNVAESESSSESDYEPASKDRNLPDLCPMDEPKKKRESRQASKTVPEAMSEDTPEEGLESPKKKWKQKAEALECSASGKKKSKKKKKSASGTKDSDLVSQDEVLSEETTSNLLESTPVAAQEPARKKTKKKKKIVYEESEQPEPEPEPEPEMAKKISKKRKSKSLSTTTEEVPEIEGSARKSKKRKQKSRDDQESEPPEEEPPTSVPSEELEQSEAGKETDEDVVIIEQEIPVHTIESSDSEDDISIPDPNLLDLDLANVTTTIEDGPDTSEFDLKNILSKMSDDPDKWKILSSDRYNLSTTKRGPRCNRCRGIGHLAIYCPNKNVLPSCALCGLQGHMEPRCPNKVCFTCGTPGNYSTVFCRKCVNRRNSSVCYLCKMPGHVGNSCPDLWRRYYLTTTTGDLTCPPKRKNLIIPRSKQWCSGCAGRGHLEYECNSYKWIREYPSSSPHIFSYNNVYKTGQSKNNRQKASEDVPDQRRITKDRVEVTIGNHRIFVEDEPEERREESSDRNVVEICPENTDETREKCSPQTNTVQELPAPLIQNRPDTPPENPVPKRGGNTRRSPRKQRLNPLSVLNSQNPTKFSPYQRMLNPCSLMGGTPQRIPSVLDSVPYNIDTVRSAALNTVQSASHGFDHLYNAVPNELLAQQILNLTSTVATNYQSSSQGNFYQGSQYSSMTSHVSPSVNFVSDEPANTFRDFSEPILENRYDEYTSFRTNYSPNQNYLNLPYTVTSEQPSPVPNNFPQGRYYENNFEDYRDSFKSLRICNVDEQTAKKFFNFSICDLRDFLDAEIQKVDKLNNPETRVYKKKLNNIEQLKRIPHKTNSINKQIDFHYKHINMFLFGIRKLAEGHRNLDFLRNFVINGGQDLPDQKRHALLEAYGYIFGGEHPNFNYRKFLNIVSLGPKRAR